MEIITMSKKELEKMEIMKQLKKRRMTQKEAAKLLELSIRQIKRLFRAYKREGEMGVISKKRGAVSNRKITEKKKKEILEIIQKKYYDFGPTLATEKLLEVNKISISKETIRTWMIEDELWKPKLKKDKKPHPSRPRRDKFGELIQIDGSPHKWFEDRGPYCNLTVFIDDATGEYMKMFFTPSETTFAYFLTTQIYLKEYGKPVAFYSDKHQIFKVNNKQTGEDVLSQFGRALTELDIELITANSPQAKGRVERANQTLQDRLVKELRLKNINTMDEANSFLDEEYKYTLSDKFSVVAKKPGSAHRVVKESEDELSRIFSIQDKRVISKDLEVYHKNKIYQIESNSLNLTMRKQKVVVCTKTDNSVELIYKNRSLKYKVFEKPTKQIVTKSSKTINNAVDDAIKKQNKN